MCAPGQNSMPNCQADEFFIQGAQNINLPSKTGGIKFDFQPPLLKVTDIKAESGDGAVVLSWQTGSGDINGFRVLCEDAATGQPVTGRTQTPPDPYAIPNGQYFYTKDNLCPNGPFSTFNSGEDNPLEPPGTTDTDGIETTGGDTGADTGDTVENTDCGNEIIEAGEECDDGDANADDAACGSDCTRSFCGDGRVQADVEECDDGNDEDGDGCTNACKNAACGDGSLWVGMETCDMGALNADGGASPCNTNCEVVDCANMMNGCPECGDGVEVAPNCDDGPLNSNNATCKSDCTWNVCGDGFVLSDPLDGGVLEECDDGNDDTTDACTEECLRAFCGDGFVWDGVEECDDGNTVDDDDCANNCREPACGDNIVQAGEECDNGVNNNDVELQRRVQVHGQPGHAEPRLALRLHPAHLVQHQELPHRRARERQGVQLPARALRPDRQPGAGRHHRARHPGRDLRPVGAMRRGRRHLRRLGLLQRQRRLERRPGPVHRPRSVRHRRPRRRQPEKEPRVIALALTLVAAPAPADMTITGDAGTTPPPADTGTVPPAPPGPEASPPPSGTTTTETRQGDLMGPPYGSRVGEKREGEVAADRGPDLREAAGPERVRRRRPEQPRPHRQPEEEAGPADRREQAAVRARGQDGHLSARRRPQLER
ncbi:DUF4215 domain-containing protein [Nannocystis pusilla]|uniref:DUF4215 domain-containing protein n=1 Tax=Nannocystis pusilla TaxID=889268 RepID=A0A9X3IYT4_9BACT|nr:DUF4215 domain-containing protein [Nannocystis pusilla]MCY1007919.1 DUF4215 domain-containing protein [Nannocystis pusilla]